MPFLSLSFAQIQKNINDLTERVFESHGAVKINEETKKKEFDASKLPTDRNEQLTMADDTIDRLLKANLPEAVKIKALRGAMLTIEAQIAKGHYRPSFLITSVLYNGIRPAIGVDKKLTEAEIKDAIEAYNFYVVNLRAQLVSDVKAFNRQTLKATPTVVHEATLAEQLKGEQEKINEEGKVVEGEAWSKARIIKRLALDETKRKSIEGEHTLKKSQEVKAAKGGPDLITRDEHFLTDGSLSKNRRIEDDAVKLKQKLRFNKVREDITKRKLSEEAEQKHLEQDKKLFVERGGLVSQTGLLSKKGLSVEIDMPKPPEIETPTMTKKM